MQEKIVILDFGSQTTQLIARRVRELNTYCEILPYNKFPKGDESVKGVILSGSPFSVYDESAFKTDLSEIRGKYPVLGICYGAQLSLIPMAARWNLPEVVNTDVHIWALLTGQCAVQGREGKYTGVDESRRHNYGYPFQFQKNSFDG